VILVCQVTLKANVGKTPTLTTPEPKQVYVGSSEVWGILGHVMTCPKWKNSFTDRGLVGDFDTTPGSCEFVTWLYSRFIR